MHEASETWRDECAERALEAITITLALLASVVASSAIKRAARIGVPLALVQIALGAFVGEVFGFRVSVAPDMFLLLFIAPLLFLDGWRISKQGLVRDKWTIGALAFGLVLFTVVAAGYFIHWLIPVMPLPVAFALAAALSPTDAVAVSEIAEGVPISKRLMHILEGEALLNDASGLVCMRFAIIAALTGSFSPLDASGSLLWLAVGGVGVGAAVALLTNGLKDWTARHFGEDPGTQILTSLLIPFGSYMLADALAASGILAAVAAGMVMSHEEFAGRALAGTRIRRAAVWDAIQFAGNGVVFILLGQQLSGIVAGAGRAIRSTGRHDGLLLVVYVVAITCSLAVLRSLWAWTTLRLMLFRTRHGGVEGPRTGWRVIAVASLAGVRGAVTLSGVMTFPLTLRDGTEFPARDLAIFLAAGVIILSLVAADIGLPHLAKGMELPQESWTRQAEDDARIAAARAAMAAMERAVAELEAGRQDADFYMEASARIAADYRRQIETRSDAGDNAQTVRKVDEIERRLRLIALSAERDALYHMGHSGKLTEDLTRMLVREVDLQESQFSPR